VQRNGRDPTGQAHKHRQRTERFASNIFGSELPKKTNRVAGGGSEGLGKEKKLERGGEFGATSTGSPQFYHDEETATGDEEIRNGK